MKSTYKGTLEIDASSLVVDEIMLMGSRCGPFAPALKLLEEDRVEVESLIHDRYPLDRALEGFEKARRPGVLKVLIDIS